MVRYYALFILILTIYIPHSCLLTCPTFITNRYSLNAQTVLALAVQDYTDFAIIFAMLLCNGYLGFHEELKAKESLDELTNKMEQRIAVLRDGNATSVLTRELVPGDVVLLVGGTAVPADVEWLDGDVLSVETGT